MELDEKNDEIEYDKPKAGEIYGAPINLLPGQDWYARFVTITSVMNQVVQDAPQLPDSYKRAQHKIHNSYLEAAKRAAGLDK
jgi:hypothetical protein